jgi:hypothetical protein
LEAAFDLRLLQFVGEMVEMLCYVWSLLMIEKRGPDTLTVLGQAVVQK